MQEVLRILVDGKVLVAEQAKQQRPPDGTARQESFRQDRGHILHGYIDFALARTGNEKPRRIPRKA